MPSNPFCCGLSVLALCLLMIFCKRFEVVWTAPLLMSQPIQRRPSLCATFGTTPDPAKQSSTMSPGSLAAETIRVSKRELGGEDRADEDGLARSHREGEDVARVVEGEGLA